MVFRRTLFRKVAILGTGLIGGSIGLALRKQGIASEVVGLGRQEASLKLAVEMGAIDEGTTDIRKAIGGADMVILAAPVKVIAEQIKDISKNLRRGCIVTDVGSTKSLVVEAAQKYFPPHVLFVGSHPLTGSEKSGIASARLDFFKGGVCILTPTDKTNRLAKDKVKHFWELLGMQVRLMDPVKHDEVLAYVSHLPHLAAFGLIRAVPDEFLQHASSGFRDTTRIAASSSQMWSEICSANYRNVLKSLDEMIRNLSDIRKAIVEQDEQTLATYFTQAKAKREVLDKK
ncbi:MAG: prephenate dehydrogenase/arogenate dehydrogenase family protein [Candidatus Omnitrophica bacterium]|nr:prephenate dehydrogenase/arogenate dehydrogenase family protein [Candidatus Omnitrophota bacterium]